MVAKATYLSEYDILRSVKVYLTVKVVTACYDIEAIVVSFEAHRHHIAVVVKACLYYSV